MDKIEDVVIDVCDQLEDADAPAEVQIVTDETAANQAKEAGRIFFLKISPPRLGAI